MADAVIQQRLREKTPEGSALGSTVSHLGPWKVYLMYLLGKEKQYGRAKEGDILYSESGTVLKITALPGYPKAVAMAVSDGGELSNISGLGSIAANDIIPKGKVTPDLVEATGWILRQIPVSQADQIKKENKETANQFRDALAVLSAGDKRGSNAQAAVGGTLGVVGAVGRKVADTVRGAANVVSHANDTSTDWIKWVISETWDRLDSTTKSLITGGTAGGVDYLIRENVGEAILVGGAAGGGMYLYTRGTDKIRPTLLEESEKAVESQDGYEKTMIAVMAKKGGTADENRQRAIGREDEWASGTHQGIPLDKIANDPSANTNLKALIQAYKSGKRMGR